MYQPVLTTLVFDATVSLDVDDIGLLLCSALVANTGTTCQQGDIRLVRGTIQQLGAVQMCVNGVWGEICADGWGSSDALVACRQLGYANAGKDWLIIFALNNSVRYII